MKLANHYYSIMSGVAASLGSFFGKMITYSTNEMVNTVGDVSCFIVVRDTNDAILHFSHLCCLVSKRNLQKI